ncbi:DJ-1/PfpI family protein [bacterium]|nr:DJ-1/PfpI family protein [bacterium]
MNRFFKNFILVFILYGAGMSLAQPKALILMSHGYGANYHLLSDKLKQLGFDLTTTGVVSNISACTSYAARYGCKGIAVDFLVTEIQDLGQYDLLLIITATKWSTTPPLQVTLQSVEALELVRQCHNHGAVLASWCSGVRLMARAGVIANCKVRGNEQYQSEYEAAGAEYVGPNHYPVTDGQIITWGRGQFYYEAAIDAIVDAIHARGN